MSIISEFSINMRYFRSHFVVRGHNLKKVRGYACVFVLILLGSCCFARAQSLSYRLNTNSLKQKAIPLRPRLNLAPPPNLPSLLHTSQDSSVNRKRLKWFIVGSTAFYATALGGLYFVWYEDGSRRDFHFFNDNAEWNQMDKVGHFYSAYHFSRASSEVLQWAGLAPRKAHFWGAMTGILMMAPIEVLDGFSDDFGASWGDFLANAAGAGFHWLQYEIWDEVRVHPKFSFRQTGLASLRPETLGDGLYEEIIKDYNGQTYWLSVDVDKFLPETSAYPKWLNWSIGYGAGNMLYSRKNENEVLGQLQSYRQVFLGPDLDLRVFRSRKKWVNTLLFVLDMVRIPAPALEYRTGDGLRWHILYY